MGIYEEPEEVKTAQAVASATEHLDFHRGAPCKFTGGELFLSYLLLLRRPGTCIYSLLASISISDSCIEQRLVLEGHQKQPKWANLQPDAQNLQLRPPSFGASKRPSLQPGLA